MTSLSCYKRWTHALLVLILMSLMSLSPTSQAQCVTIDDLVPELTWELGSGSLDIDRFDVWRRVRGETEWSHLAASLCTLIPGDPGNPNEPGSGWPDRLKCAGLVEGDTPWPDTWIEDNVSVPVMRWISPEVGAEIEFAASAANSAGVSGFSNVVCAIIPLTCDVETRLTNENPPQTCWMIGDG